MNNVNKKGALENVPFFTNNADFNSHLDDTIQRKIFFTDIVLNHKVVILFLIDNQLSYAVLK